MDIGFVLDVVMIVSSILMILSILLQARGASLGAGFGASGELFTTRRGLEKNLYDTTIVLAIIFIGSLLMSLMV